MQMDLAWFEVSSLDHNSWDAPERVADMRRLVDHYIYHR